MNRYKRALFELLDFWMMRFSFLCCRKGSAVVGAGVAAEASFVGMQRNVIRHMSVYVSKPDIAGKANVVIGLAIRPQFAKLHALGAGLARRQSIQP